MAPVVAVATHPGRQAGGDDRAVDARRELLRAGEQRVAVDDQRQRLDDAGVGVVLHRDREPRDGLAGHQAVGVEHQHVIVGAAPAGDEIGDVAGLAMVVLRPVAVVDPGARFELVAPCEKGPLLGDPGVGVGRVGEDEVVEMIAEPGRFDLLAHGFECRESARRRLVVDRHHHRGAGPQIVRKRRQWPGLAQQDQEAEEPAREGEGDPREVEGEEQEQDALKDRRAADRHDLVHLAGAVGGQRRRPTEHEKPGEPGRAIGIGCGEAPPVLGRPARERLDRHFQAALGRHRGRGARGREPCDLDRSQGVHR